MSKEALKLIPPTDEENPYYAVRGKTGAGEVDGTTFCKRERAAHIWKNFYEEFLRANRGSEVERLLDRHGPMTATAHAVDTIREAIFAELITLHKAVEGIAKPEPQIDGSTSVAKLTDQAEKLRELIQDFGALTADLALTVEQVLMQRGAAKRRRKD